MHIVWKEQNSNEQDAFRRVVKAIYCFAQWEKPAKSETPEKILSLNQILFPVFKPQSTGAVKKTYAWSPLANTLNALIKC